MADYDPKDDLRRYLQAGRDAVVWKVEGLGEYDARRPLVATATNLLGLVKHLAHVEAGYFGEVSTLGTPTCPTMTPLGGSRTGNGSRRPPDRQLDDLPGEGDDDRAAQPNSGGRRAATRCGDASDGTR